MLFSRQFLTTLLLTIGLLAFAAPVEEKVLFSIQDKAADFALPGIANQVVEAPGEHAGQALKVVYPQYVEGQNKWPAVYFRKPLLAPVSLDGWDGFVFTVHNPLEERVDLGIAINGAAAQTKPFGKHVLLQPNAWSHFIIPVEEFYEVVGGQIDHFDFFMTTPDKEYILYYDDVKLVRRNPPDETVLPSVVTLADFEGSALPPQFECNGMTGELTGDWSKEGAQSILLKYPAYRVGNPPWPAFQFYTAADPRIGFDWSAYSRLTFAVNYTGGNVLPLKVYLADAHGKAYSQECTVNPGMESTFTVDLPSTALDLRQMQQVDFFLSRPEMDYSVFIDSIQLVTAGPEELAGAQATLARLGQALELVAGPIHDELLPEYQQLVQELAIARETAGNAQNTMQDLRKMADFSLRLQKWIFRNSRRMDEALLCKQTASVFPQAPFGLGIADSMTKVMIRDLALQDVAFQTSVSLELARNEYESFQVVAVGRPEDDAPAAIAAVEASPLRQGDYELPANAVSVSLVGHVDCKQPPYAADYNGWYPDPLLDFQQQASVAPHEAVAFWVRVKAPADAPAGEYRGNVTIRGNGEVVAELPLAVTVHDFTLPNGCPYPLATSFRDHIKQVWDPKMSQERHDALLRKIVDRLAEYRLSYDQIYRRVPKDPKSLNIPVEILKQQRDSGVLKSFCLLNFDTPHGCTDPDDPRVQQCIDGTLASLDYWVPILKREGLYEYAFAYGYDEYTPVHFPVIEKVCAAIKARYPELPIGTTLYDHSFGTASCLKSIDIFTPLTPRYEPEVVAKARATGRTVWWYICIGPHHPYANWFVEYPAIEARLLMGAMTAKYRPEGFLYYALTRWPENHNPITGGPYTDWNPASFQTANGDGSLFCAGPDGLLGTIRSENFRDGIEDYCYVLELERRLAAAPAETATETLERARKALEVPGTLVYSLDHFSRSPAELRAWRSQLLEAIDSLK